VAPAPPREEPGSREQAGAGADTVVRSTLLFGSWAYGAACLAVADGSSQELAAAVQSPSRPAFATIVASGVVFGLLVGCVAAGLASHPTAARLGERLARLIAAAFPLCLLGGVPLLLDRDAWRARPLEGLLVLLAFTVVGVWLLHDRRRAPADRMSSHPRGDGPAWKWLVASGIAVYVGAVGWATIAQHRLLETRAYDLAIMENTLWNSCEGRWFHSALEGGSHLGVHTSFILAALLPAYCAFPGASVLLLAQALLLGAAAWPLFLIGRQLIGEDRAAAVLALAYLLHPALAGANFYDFHELAFLPLLVFAAFHWLLRRNHLLLAVCVALLLMVKEDMAIVVALLGVASLGLTRWRVSAALLVAGVASYVLLQHVAIPYFAGGEHSFTWYYEDMAGPGEGPLGVVVTALLAPLQALGFASTYPKLLYLAQLLVPLVGLALLGARGMLLASYGLAAALLASREPLYSLGFQYALLVLPGVLIGAAEVLGRLRRDRPRLFGPLCLAIVFTTAVVTHHFGPWSGNFRAGFRTVRFDRTAEDAGRLAELQTAAGRIPAGAAVTASETLVPHVARRRQVQTVRYATQRGWDYEYFLLFHEDVGTFAPGLLMPGAATKVFEGRYIVLFRLNQPGNSDLPFPGSQSG
jgi:uncharacterized membrane protein